MGALTLPISETVYVDTNTVIYRVEEVKPYIDVARPLWDALDAGTQDIATSELSALEALIKPLRLQNASLQELFLGTLYHTPGLLCILITRQILESAAQVRATLGLKTPDAIHAATALIEGCTLFVTNDVAFRRVLASTLQFSMRSRSHPEAS
ncbi:MAG: PIN domain-containing protein [Roseiflexaceae bacterium]